jgi:hypothetical protein
MKSVSKKKLGRKWLDSKWTAGNKAIGAFALVFILSAILSAISIAGIKTVRDNTKNRTEDWLRGIEEIIQITRGRSSL